MNFIKKNIVDLLPSFLFITLGCLIAAYAINGFLVPNLILDGGVVGVSMIINKLTAIKLSVLVAILNIPFLIAGYKEIGNRFVIKACYAIIIYSILLAKFETVTPFTSDEILATIFGGMLLGLGVGLVIRFGGCLDGTETIGIMISKKTSFSVGQIVLFFNIVIFGIAGFLFGFDRAMYSLLTYFITSKIIDLIDTGLNEAKAVMIITNEGEQISQEIYNKLGRTTTLLEGEGLISGKKIVLYCVVTRIEINEIKRIIHETDGSAFVTVTDVNEIVGKHIKKYKKETNATKEV